AYSRAPPAKTAGRARELTGRSGVLRSGKALLSGGGSGADLLVCRLDRRPRRSERCMAPEADGSHQACTGVPGLDDVLIGGCAPGHALLLEGSPGTGKTTIAHPSPPEGPERGESRLY